MPADTRLWHPFADMHAVRGNEFVIARGDGALVWDEEGAEYLDGTASLWCVNVGHGRDEIVEAASAQMRRLASYQTFGVFANRPALDLAERLADLAPLDDPRIFLGSGGGDAIDTAAKLARRYFAAIGTPERTHLISRSQGYHGTHGLGTSIGGIPANRQDVGPLDPNASVVPYDSLEALEAEIERLGTWFGIERWGVRPDMLTFAKGVTSGYLPLGGVVVGAKVAAPFWDDGAWFRHGPTYSGHPTVCAAAMANLDIIERESLLDRGRELEDEIASALRPLGDHPLVGEIRTGIGALGAIAFGAEALAQAPDLPARLFAALRERGVLLRPLGDGLAFSPPLVITRDQVERVAEVAGEALEAVARDVPAAVGAR